MSCGSRGTVPPAARALAISSSTCALLSQDRQVSTSVVVCASEILRGVKVWKNSSTSSIA